MQIKPQKPVVVVVVACTMGQGSVHTDAFSLVCVSVVIENAPTDSCPLYLRTSTLKRSKMIQLQVVTYVELYRHHTNTRACDSLGHRFHFDAFSTVFDRPHKNDMYAFSFWSRLSRALSNRCVFDKNAERFSEDGKPKRIEMYAKTQNVNEM